MKRNGPDYMLIGAQKAGSTWIYENLIRHPQIMTPEIYPEVGETELTRKEITFFNDRNRAAMGLDFYMRRFEHVPIADRVVGDHTCTYHDMPVETVRRISELFPMLKIILSIRNPVDRAWSQAKMHYRIFHGKAVSEVPERDVLFFLTEHHKFGAYTASLKVWRQYFRENAIMVTWFDDIAMRPWALLCDLCDFLGVSRPRTGDGYPVLEYFVKGASEPMPEHYRKFLEQLFEPELRALSIEFPARVASWMEKNK